MEPVTAPIIRNERGPAVQNLQDALRLLLASPPSEVDQRALIERLAVDQRERVYGDMTMEAVAAFQRERRVAFDLPLTTGEQVDAPTAAGMNKMLRELGAFEPIQPTDARQVRGFIVDETGAPVVGVTVRVSDRDIGNDPEALGQQDEPVHTDARGHFQITYERKEFEAGDGVERLARAKIKADLVFSITQGDRAIEKLEVVRLPVEGDETITTELPVGPEELILGIVARDDELVRIQAADVDRARGPSEFETLLKALEPLTMRRALAEFDEERTRDVSFAAREIGVDRSLVTDIVAAHRLGKAPFSKVPPAALYGLARLLGARDARQLATRRIDELVDGLKKAIPLTIPPLDVDLLHLGTDLHDVAIGEALAVRLSDGAGTLNDVLSASLPNPTIRAKLLSSAVNHTGTDADYWAKFSAEHPEVQVAPVQYALHLGALTSNNVVLMTALQREVPDATSMRALALHLDDQRLAEIIDSSGAAPADAREDETPAAARARLSMEIGGLLTAAHPTSVVARLAKGWHAADPDAVTAPVVDALSRAVLRTDFDLATGTVDELVKKHSDVLFAGVADASVREHAVEGIKRVQRLFQVSPDPKTLGHVVLQRRVGGLPFRGGLDIARFSKGAFAARFADAPADVQESLSFMHDRSRSLADTVASLLVAQHQDARDLRPAAAGDTVELGTDLSEVKKAPAAPPTDGAPAPVAPPAAVGTVDDIPSWSDFFGGAEVCECNECRSIIGQAAYLVDLLEFLDKRCTPDANQVTPLDILIGHPTKRASAGAPEGIVGRRPDIAHIKLSCENTNTTIPTIDLINEILESVVAFGQIIPLRTGVDGEPLHPPSLSPNEPSLNVTGAELSAAPEHVVERAYRLVGRATFPVSLPFDRLMATARANIRQAGSSRGELIRLFGKGDIIARNTEAAETLGLLARDVEILTFTKLSGEPLDAAIPTEALYGMAVGDPAWPAKLSNVRTALATLEISFEELVALLRTRFVGGEVPTADDGSVASRLFLDVDQLKDLRAADFLVAPDSRTALALARGGLTAEQVQEFVESRNERLATTLVLDPPTSCDPDTTRIRHLDASDVQAEEWLALHRFVRLAKRMSLSFEELDVALFAAAGATARPTFDAATLEHLADLKALKESLKLSWPVAASLVTDIDIHGRSSLYDALFVSRGIDRVHPLFRRGANGELFALPAALTAGTPALAVAFSSDLTRLNDLGARLELEALSLASVSSLHRVMVTAGALGLEANELIGLCDALEEPSLRGGDRRTPWTMLQLVRRLRKLTAAGLSGATIAYLAGGATVAADRVGRSTAELGKLIEGLPGVLAPLLEREELERSEEQERADAEKPLSADDITRRKLEGIMRRRNVALEYLGQAFGLEDQVLATLVEDRTTEGKKALALLRSGAADDPAISLFSSPVANADRSRAASLFRTIDRVSVLTASLELDPFAFDLARVAGLLLPELLADSPDRKVVAAALEDLADFVLLLRDTSRPAALAQCVGALAASAGNDWDQVALVAAAEWLGQTVEAVKSVPRDAVPELVVTAARRQPIRALSALRERLLVARRLGMGANEIVELIVEPLGSTVLARLVAGVRSHYEATTWLEVSRQLSDPIREASRDALIAFLLNRDGLAHADQLFGRYFIDCKTSSFVLTSRIRQAIFAVQIYVQRVLMGSERKNGVAPEQINVAEWQTISRQPIWAARNKTLLWPEELLNPGWRDDKTKIFRTFEATIRQSDVTPANAARAYGTYLDDFRVIASLEVCGTFLQTVFEGNEAGLFTSVLHVVGRTRGGIPRRYFYRRLNRYANFEEWTGWEPVEADIQGIERDRVDGRKQNADDKLFEAGVHVLPVIWRGEVHLFWPTFVRKVDVPADLPLIDPKNPATVRGRFSLPYWEVKLCWTRRQGDAWTPKEQSSALIETWWSIDHTVDYVGGPGAPTQPVGPIPNKDEPQFPDPADLVLKAHSTGGETLQIVLGQRSSSMGAVPRFTFSFHRVASEMESAAAKTSARPAGDHPRFVARKGQANAPQAQEVVAPSFMGIRARGLIDVVADSKKPEGDHLFTAPPESVRISTLNQGYATVAEAPLFIGLSNRTYYAKVSPAHTTAREVIANPTPTPNASAFVDKAVLGALAGQAISAIPQNAQRSASPWVRADAVRLGALIAPAVQSLPEIGPVNGNRFVTTGRESAAVERLVQRLGPSYRTIDGVNTVNLTVQPFFHPFAERFVTTLKRDGLNALLAPEMQRLPLASDPAETFASSCKPNPERVTAPSREGVDFDLGSPYGAYNWELFFHAPMVVIQKLWDNNQLDSAIEMFHTVFDPLFAGADPNDAWRFEGLRGTRSLRLDDLLALLSRGDEDPGKKQVLAQIETMRLYPFQAHRIARLRPSAYKKWAVAQYARLRLAAGDRHFRRFTPEDVNLCVQNYLIASAVMGRHPEDVPQRVSMPALSYAELRPNLDALGNVMFEAETKLISVGSGSAVSATDTTASGMLQRGAVGYFGIPKNEKLLALWDEVEDRLFKVRNGMNIDGLQIQLPLFSPPVDPAVVAQALASGLTISDVSNALASRRPHHTYPVLHRKAVDHAQALVGLGEALLAAREKGAAEELTLLRSVHEKQMANLLERVREDQVAEAKASRDLVLAEREAPLIRWSHFRDLLGASNILPPGPDARDPATIHNGRGQPMRPLSLVEASSVEFESLQVIPDIAKGLATAGSPRLGAVVPDLDESAGGIRLAGGKILDEEKQELQESFEAVRATFDAATFDLLAAVLGFIPNFEGAVKPLGAGAAVHFGGQALSAAASAKARNKHAVGSMHTFLSMMHGKQAGFVLREREWVAQMNQAASDVLAIDRKLAVANLVVSRAEHERDNQAKALADATEIEAHLRDKFTSAELYDWLGSHWLRLYRRCLAVATESAQLAAASYAVQRDPLKPPFVAVTRAGDAREELLAGHELLASLRDMDKSWMASSARGPELIRHISLKQLNPWALNDLRERGEALFSLPEVLFDIDHSGHYDRRIRSIQVSVPCVSGPYAPVTGTLTLLGSRRRSQPRLADELVEDGATGQPSISLSTGRDDAGLFELSLQDELYLPFQGFGAISDWRLRFPEKLRQYNYRTVTDVILTVRLESKAGGEAFGKQVSDKIAQALNALKLRGSDGPYQLVSLRHDFPDAWARFQASGSLSVELSTDILSYMLRRLNPKLQEVHAIRLPKLAPATAPAALNIVQKGAAWTVDVPPMGAPGDLDDINLFTRFKLA